MKKLLFLASILLVWNIAYSQTFKIEPDTLIRINGTTNDDQLIGVGKFTNTTKEKRTYKWTRINKSLPTGWIATTCVPGFCYTAEIESGSFELSPSGFGILDQNFYMEGIPGLGQATIQLYDVANPKEVVTIRYVAFAKDATTGMASGMQATDYFTVLADAIEIKTQNINGNQVRLAVFDTQGVSKLSFVAALANNNANIQIDISALPQGLYTLLLMGDEHLYISKKIIKN